MIIGHQFPISYLDRLASQNGPSGAYLFTGPDNVGKAHTAYEFAKWAMGEHRESFVEFSDNSCTCSSCYAVDCKTHLDIYIGSAPLGMEEVRSMRTALRSSPLLGPWNVGIIEQADELSDAALQTLLKVMEELPDRGMLFLTARSKRSVLPTIASRALVIPFGFVSLSEIERGYTKEIGALKKWEVFWRGRPGRVRAMLADKNLPKQLMERKKQADTLINGTRTERFALIQKIVQEKDKQGLVHAFAMWEDFMQEAGGWHALKAFEEARKSIFLGNANPHIALSWAVMQGEATSNNA